MSEYLSGLLTLPVLIGLWFGYLWAFDRNYGLECGHCGKLIGKIHVNPKIATVCRWYIHKTTCTGAGQ